MMTRLKELRIEHDLPGSLEDVRHLRELRVLELPDAQVADADISVINSMRSLEELVLPRACITSVGLQELIDGPLRLELLALPETHESWETRVLESGVAKKVDFRRGAANGRR